MIPKSVTLNKNKASIQIEYNNSSYLLLTASYLRACSPSAENKNRLKDQEYKTNKELFRRVLIDKIEAVGNYAIRIIFDDGHKTGIFSWDYLFSIGSKSQDSSTP